MAAQIRRSRAAKADDRKRTTVKVGGREDYRVFKFSGSVSPKEIEARVARLKEIYKVCQGWNDLSNFIAEPVRKGTVPVPMPHHSLARRGVISWEGWTIWRRDLVRLLPTVPWETLSESNVSRAVLGAVRHIKFAEIKQASEIIADIDAVDVPILATPVGSLYEALDTYLAYVTKTEPKNLDRHAKIKQLRLRHADQPLATIGLDACRNLIDYWRQRPHRHDGAGQYTVKRSREQLAELCRFLEWLHLSDEFTWREPVDFHRLDRSVQKDGASRKSILKSKIAVFSVSDLATLVRNAGMPEKLWIVWCLNNSHGAAEVGRVQWEDLYLNQDHPWREEGLNIWEGGDWVGFLRPKTDVLGWWLLWPETVKLLLEWKQQCRQSLNREVSSEDSLIIRSSGLPLYGSSKNAQSGFANAFERLKKRCKRVGHPVADLPAGTLRNQFSDWCGGEEANATIAAVALSHGLPHKGDKLLYKHYSNRPWRRLFEKQMEYREHCRVVLAAIGEEPNLPANVRAFWDLWPQLTGKKMERVTAASVALKVSSTTIYRYLSGELESEE